jgi:hypothetical protein
MQRQISNWRKKRYQYLLKWEQAMITQNSTGKRGKFFQKYKVTNAREIAQMTETLKQKVQAKAQRIIRYEKRKNQYIQNKMFNEDIKKFYRNLGTKNIEAREPHLWQKLSLTGSHCGEK